MDRFIHDENMRHYRRLLERTTDPDERARILALLAEEDARTDCPSPPGPRTAASLILGGQKNQ
jgi:hypothetical protein